MATGRPGRPRGGRPEREEEFIHLVANSISKTNKLCFYVFPRYAPLARVYLCCKIYLSIISLK
jgi:hypothetical protein